ncbi:MAG: hypothetical protein NWP87_06750 [Winogradskyella sp.]|nr:hypothetical protein [Winogradskyella sp.]
MKIKTLKFSIYLLSIISLFIACNNDDDELFTFVEADRTEQQVLDKSSLLTYLSTHYYNSSFFATGSDHKYTDIVIEELPQDEDGNYLDLPDPDQNTLLIDDIETYTVEYLETEYEYYILKLNQGEGDSPEFTDFVRVRYEGSSIETGLIFDSTVIPFDQQLQGNLINSFGAIKGWQLAMPQFNASSGFSTDNGVVDFNNFGLGIMFLPSGLAYFSGTNTGSLYDNLIFKIELLQVAEIDHDNDGIPSYIEDLNSNFVVEDDDTDGNATPDFIDNDDDGDRVLTRNELISKQYIVNTNIGEEEPVFSENEYEISRSDDFGVITINTVTPADVNNDGIPDYLDETIAIDYNED